MTRVSRLKVTPVCRRGRKAGVRTMPLAVDLRRKRLGSPALLHTVLVSLGRFRMLALME